MADAHACLLGERASSDLSSPDREPRRQLGDRGARLKGSTGPPPSSLEARHVPWLAGDSPGVGGPGQLGCCYGDRCASV